MSIVGEVSRNRILGDYYLDYAGASEDIGRGAVGPLDARGVPLADYDVMFRGHPDIDQSRTYGTHYTPVTIAEYGLGLWSRHLAAPDAQLRSRFLAQADWFVSSLRPLPGFGVWLHEFEFPIYQLKSPWVSAMAQGQGISVLLRAFQLTDDARYLDAASSAFGAFGYSIQAGGVASRENGEVWLEEYPTSPRTHVLNGFVYALWGVLDFARVTGSDDAHRLWQEGIATLRGNLWRYEIACWSRYDLLSRQIAVPHYHRLHVRQLEVLASLTGDAVLRAYHQRWQSYLDGAYWWRRTAEKKARGMLRRLGLLSQPSVQGVSVDLVRGTGW